MTVSTPEISDIAPREAAKSLLGMVAILLFTMWIWDDRPYLPLAGFSFSIFFMTLVASTLCFIEARTSADKENPALDFCLFAVVLLGFSGTLFLASGYWPWAAVAFLKAAALALHRRRVVSGMFGLLPAAGLDLGLVGGLGAAVAGAFLAGINLVAA
ncbi:MAG: hypothetical protein AAF718_14775 [Pseudomonadota bacterium]